MPAIVRVKRSQFATYINTTPLTTATWTIIGRGATAAKETMNPKVTSEVYINANTAEISLDSYAPTMPVKLTAFAGEPIFEFLRGLKNNRSILGDAETQIISVALYEAPVSGAYPASQQNVSIQVDDFGDEGGVRMQCNFTINFQGAPTLGSFNPSSNTFTASATTGE